MGACWGGGVTDYSQPAALERVAPSDHHQGCVGKRTVPPPRGAHFGLACLRELLHSYGVLLRDGFKAHMAGFAGRPPIRNLLAMEGYTTRHLRTVCTPGAWLLDTVYTLVQAMHGRIQPNCQYVAVLNDVHLDLFSCCFPEMAREETGSSLNNRGNQVEALAWLVVEMDRVDLLLAMAYHLDVWSHDGGAAGVQGAQGAPGGDAGLCSATATSLAMDAYWARSKLAEAAQSAWPAQAPSPDWQQGRADQPTVPSSTWGGPQRPHSAGPPVAPASPGPDWEQHRRNAGSWKGWGSCSVSNVQCKPPPPPPSQPELRRPPPAQPYVFSHRGKVPATSVSGLPLPRQCFPG